MIKINFETIYLGAPLDVYEATPLSSRGLAPYATYHKNYHESIKLLLAIYDLQQAITLVQGEFPHSLNIRLVSRMLIDKQGELCLR